MDTNMSTCTPAEAAWRTMLSADASTFAALIEEIAPSAVIADGLVDLAELTDPVEASFPTVHIVERGVL